MSRMLTAQFAEHRRVKVYLLSTAILLSVLVGCTRVYLGVHWPSDVLAGWAIGLSWALVCWIVAVWLQDHTLGCVIGRAEAGRDRLLRGLVRTLQDDGARVCQGCGADAGPDGECSHAEQRPAPDVRQGADERAAATAAKSNQHK